MAAALHNKAFPLKLLNGCSLQCQGAKILFATYTADSPMPASNALAGCWRLGIRSTF